MKRTQQFDSAFADEPFSLVAEVVTDQDRINREREAKAKDRAEAAKRQIAEVSDQRGAGSLH